MSGRIHFRAPEWCGQDMGRGVCGSVVDLKWGHGAQLPWDRRSFFDMSPDKVDCKSCLRWYRANSIQAGATLVGSPAPALAGDRFAALSRNERSE
jgi:hypothetical protein